MNAQGQSPAIGIDLGTTYSCVGVYRNGKVEIVQNDQGHNTTPSYVSFTENERKIGDTAKSEAIRNVKNTVFDSKRLIGRLYADQCVQDDKKHWPFEVEEGPNGKPFIAVTSQGEKRKFYPEEISAAILLKLKQCVENYIEQKVTDAVITVPAYFNDNQRQATKDAAQIAGLNCIRIINEPTAAAIAYGLNKSSSKQEQSVLIFDLGGGTFDVTVLTLRNEFLEVKSSTGDGHLGGEDFDNKLVDYCVEEFKAKMDIDISKNQKALRRLREECEKQKRNLSSDLTVTVQVVSIADGEDLYIELTRAKFDDICKDLFLKCIVQVEEALKSSKLSKEQIDQVVLCGGSSRIPKIQKMLSDFFNGKALCKEINPDEAVAYGATVQAALLKKVATDNKAIQLYVQDVIPFTLGVLVADGAMEPLIRKDTTVPCFHAQIFTTYHDNQDAVQISIFQGERPMAEDNHLLGKFTMSGIPPAKAGVPKIKVNFFVDENSILTVKVVDDKSGSSSSIQIKNIKESVFEEERKRMIKEAISYQEHDEKIRVYREARLQLQKHCIKIKNMLENLNLLPHITSDDKQTIEAIAVEGEEWVKKNANADFGTTQQKKNEIDAKFKPIRDRLYQAAGIQLKENADDDDIQ